jgi:hypothetical protein
MLYNGRSSLAAAHICYAPGCHSLMLYVGKIGCRYSHPLDCWPPGADAETLVVLSSVGLSPEDAELLRQKGIKASVRGRLRPSADGADVLVDL